MKLIVYFTLTITFMSFSNSQDLLGKHISETSVYKDFLEPFPEDNIYYVLTNSHEKIYGINYNYAIIRTDDKGIIENITISFSEIISRSFYDAFISAYNKPNSIKIIDESQVISKSERQGEFKRNAEKRFITTKEGSFEEKPLYIYWDKEDYLIKIILKHNSKKSEIKFTRVIK